MSHTCHAHGCSSPVPPRMFMCRTHWRALTPALQRAIWREYRPGQERTKTPTLRYMAVAQWAIGNLVFRPHDEEAARVAAPYMLKAEVYRVLAIKQGHGDPMKDNALTTLEPQLWLDVTKMQTLLERGGQ